MKKPTITLHCDARKATAAIEELKTALELDFDVLRHSVQDFFDGLDSLGDLLCIKPAGTEGTDAFYSLEPSDRFVDFLAAMRARQ
jgi:hypothetical protein